MPQSTLQTRAEAYQRKTLQFLQNAAANSAVAERPPVDFAKQRSVPRDPMSERSEKLQAKSNAVVDTRERIVHSLRKATDEAHDEQYSSQANFMELLGTGGRDSSKVGHHSYGPMGCQLDGIATMVQKHFEIVKKTNRRHQEGHPMSSYIQRMQFLRVAEDVRGQRKNIFTAAFNRRELAKSRVDACKLQWDIIEKRREEIRERERRERMRLLRETNFDEYVKLVRETKDNRLMELLDQTDNFLSIMGSRIETQKNSTAMPGAPRSSGAGDNITEHKKTKLKGTQGAHVQQEYYNNTHLLQEKVKQPNNFVGKLMPYQLAGLDFMVSLYNNRLSGILADEMGLGKTVQTIALLGHLLEVKHNPGPHLIIVPLSTLPNWTTEFTRFCPEMKVLAFKGSPDERQLVARKIKKGLFNVLLTTYDYVLREKQLLSGPRWRYVIVDEGHRMKNKSSKFHITLSDKTFHNTHRLLLTGTPLQNNLGELWSLLNFILPKIFTSTEDFTKWFEKPFADSKTDKNTTEALQLSEEEQFLVINRLHAVLRPFLLRRIKSEVLGDLPDKLEFIVRAQLTPWQRVVYSNVKNKVKLADSRIKKASLNNTFMQLRKIVNHPYLFESEYWIGENLLRVSAKFELLDRMLQKLVKTKHKVLVFCQMTQLMDVLHDFLAFRKIKSYRLDGAVTIDQRQERMAEFNSDDTDTYVFILSTRAGGLGVNLQAADTVIIFDSDWNPHQDLQAQARAHRMGQKNEVRVFRFVTISGIEEAVLFRSEAKLSMDAKVIQSGAFHKDGLADADNHESRLRAAILGDKEDKQGDSFLETRSTTPEELNRYLARSDDEERMFNEMDRQHFNIPKRVAKKVHENVPPIVDLEGIDYGSHDDQTLLRLQAANRLMDYNEVPKEWVTEQAEEPAFDATERRGRAARKNIATQFIQDIESASSISGERSDDEDFAGPPATKRGRGRGRGRGGRQKASSQDEALPVAAVNRGRGRGGRKRVAETPVDTSAKPKKRQRRAPLKLFEDERVPSLPSEDGDGTPPRRKSARIRAKGTSTPSSSRRSQGSE